AVVVETNDGGREMIEIAENLHRAGLTKAERDQHIRRYAELLKRRAEQLQSGQHVQIESRREDKRGHRPQGVAKQIADETGLSARTVKRALAPEKPKPAQKAGRERHEHGRGAISGAAVAHAKALQIEQEAVDAELHHLDGRVA